MTGRGEVRGIYIGGDHVGGDKISIHGDHNTVTGRSAAVDLRALMTFVSAVERDLDLVDLADDDRRRARDRVRALRAAAEEPEPDHQRLRALAAGLRSVLQKAAGDALSAYLTGLWSPGR